MHKLTKHAQQALDSLRFDARVHPVIVRIWNDTNTDDHHLKLYRLFRYSAPLSTLAILAVYLEFLPRMVLHVAVVIACSVVTITILRGMYCVDLFRRANRCSNTPALSRVLLSPSTLLVLMDQKHNRPGEQMSIVAELSMVMLLLLCDEAVVAIVFGVLCVFSFLLRVSVRTMVHRHVDLLVRTQTTKLAL